MAEIAIAGGRATKLIITIPTLALSFDNVGLRTVLAEAGHAIVTRASALLGRSGTGRAYAATRRYPAGTASAPGTPPASRSGHLQSSFTSTVKAHGLNVTVADGAHYALFLESGAHGGGGKLKGGKSSKNIHRRHRKGEIGKTVTQRVMAERPFLSRAVDELWPSLEPKIEAAALAGLRLNS